MLNNKLTNILIFSTSLIFVNATFSIDAKEKTTMEMLIKLSKQFDLINNNNNSNNEINKNDNYDQYLNFMRIGVNCIIITGLVCMPLFRKPNEKNNVSKLLQKFIKSKIISTENQMKI